MFNPDNVELIENRAKGQFPLSISTSLALEGALGILEEKPNPAKPPIQDFDEIFFNLRTLFRNINGCYKKDEENRLSPGDYAHMLIEEMTIIQSVLDQHTGGRVRAFFYACTYNNLTGLFKSARFKEARTPAQLHYANQENKTLELISKALREEGRDFLHFDTIINGNKKKTLMVTHYPIDLLANQFFSEIGLLESHTGVVKPRSLWYTKLLNGKDLTRIPFDIMTIQFFGDSGHLFSPYPIKYREALLEVANKYQWTPVTTKERIKLTVGLYKNADLEKTVMKLYSTFL